MQLPEARIAIPEQEELCQEEIKWISGTDTDPDDRRFYFLRGCISTGDGTLSPLLLKKDFVTGRWRCRLAEWIVVTNSL